MIKILELFGGIGELGKH